MLGRAARQGVADRRGSECSASKEGERNHRDQRAAPYALGASVHDSSPYSRHIQEPFSSVASYAEMRPCALGATRPLDHPESHGDRESRDGSATLLTYAYAIGERSSRVIERRCGEAAAFRVTCANQVLEHATIARPGLLRCIQRGTRLFGCKLIEPSFDQFASLVALMGR